LKTQTINRLFLVIAKIGEIALRLGLAAIDFLDKPNLILSGCFFIIPSVVSILY
jgi:hypothetical protein